MLSKFSAIEYLGSEKMSAEWLTAILSTKSRLFSGSIEIPSCFFLKIIQIAVSSPTLSQIKPQHPLPSWPRTPAGRFNGNTKRIIAG